MTANGQTRTDEPDARASVGADSGPPPTGQPWWARLKMWQFIVAPLVTVLLAAGATAIVGDVFASDPKPVPRLAAPLLVRNPPPEAEYDSAEDGDRQTDESKPMLDLMVYNAGDARAVLNLARFTIREFGVIKDCIIYEGDGAVLQISAEYDVELPLRPRRGETVDSPIHQEVAPDGADRFAFRFGNPELGPYDTYGYVYVLDVALTLGADHEDVVELGSILVSLPGTPSLATAAPDEDFDRACVEENRRLLAELTQGDVTVSPELGDLTAALAS